MPCGAQRAADLASILPCSLLPAQAAARVSSAHSSDREAGMQVQNTRQRLCHTSSLSILTIILPLLHPPHLPLDRPLLLQGIAPLSLPSPLPCVIIIITPALQPSPLPPPAIAFPALSAAPLPCPPPLPASMPLLPIPSLLAPRSPCASLVSAEPRPSPATPTTAAPRPTLPPLLPACNDLGPTLISGLCRKRRKGAVGHSEGAVGHGPRGECWGQRLARRMPLAAPRSELKGRIRRRKGLSGTKK